MSYCGLGLYGRDEVVLWPAAVGGRVPGRSSSGCGHAARRTDLGWLPGGLRLTLPRQAPAGLCRKAAITVDDVYRYSITSFFDKYRSGGWTAAALAEERTGHDDSQPEADRAAGDHGGCLRLAVRGRADPACRGHAGGDGHSRRPRARTGLRHPPAT